MTAESIATWVSVLANVVMAIGVLFAWRQLVAIKDQTRADHERSRRQVAIDLMTAWVKNHTPQASIARTLVEGFARDQVEAMWKQASFEIPLEKKDLVIGALINSSNLEFTQATIKLTRDESSELRWQIITFLNGLECVLAGWHHNVADRFMIEEQFASLVSSSEGHYLLKTFRELAGVPNYPALHAFADYIERKNRTAALGKPPAA